MFFDSFLEAKYFDFWIFSRLVVKGFEGSRIQGFKCVVSNDFIDKYPDTIDMISVKSLDPCSILAFHSNPRPLGPLNPGEESNFLGDESDFF